ncbi:hypothetical protein ORL82_23755 [Bacillus cereus]|uniref:hypothetical protein n=1 Tax=Bacillus cereus TaxID=1396 RepID=UPI002ABED4E5|nr:hypothetical protein [Bacillus cereus]MDZ4427309.1 hypothetical protein [Bacillus cereus]
MNEVNDDAVVSAVEQSVSRSRQQTAAAVEASVNDVVDASDEVVVIVEGMK